MLVVPYAIWKVGRIRDAVHPLGEALAVLSVLVSFVIIGFAAGYYSMAVRGDQFPDIHTRLDYYGRGMGEDAIACFRRALTADGRLADAWVNLGLVLQEAGEIAAPIAVNDHALALRPGHGAALSNGLMTRHDGGTD